MSVESKLKLYWIGLVDSLLLKNVVHGPDKVVMEENDDKDPVPTKDNPIKTRWQSILVKWKKQHPKQSNTSKAQQAYIEWAEHLVQDVMATYDMGPDEETYIQELPFMEITPDIQIMKIMHLLESPEVATQVTVESTNVASTPVREVTAVTIKNPQVESTDVASTPVREVTIKNPQVEPTNVASTPVREVTIKNPQVESTNVASTPVTEVTIKNPQVESTNVASTPVTQVTIKNPQVESTNLASTPVTQVTIKNPQVESFVHSVISAMILNCIQHPSHHQVTRYDARLRALLRILVYCFMSQCDSSEASMERRHWLFLQSEAFVAEHIWRMYCQSKETMPTGSHVDPQQATLQEDENEQDKWTRRKKWIKIGLASVGGSVAVGLTGGLAAPLIGAGLATVFSSLGVGAGAVLGASLCSTAGAAVLGTLFGVTGGGITGKNLQEYSSSAYKFNRRLKDIEEFSFHRISSPPHSLHLVICISGWLDTLEDVWEPWEVPVPFHSPWSESVALIYDPEHLLELGKAVQDFLASTVVTTATTTFLRVTVFSAVLSALAWPIGLIQLSYIVDNPWSVALNRAERAGRVLAREVFAKHVQGARPVSLVGWSMGARVIYYCCIELAEKGLFGLIDSVFLLGAPIPVTRLVESPQESFEIDMDGWFKMRSVCAGRIVNGYSKKDWLLSFLFRAMAGSQSVAGLGPVILEPLISTRYTPLDSLAPSLTIENVDLSDIVAGHSKYKEALSEILKRVGFEKDAFICC